MALFRQQGQVLREVIRVLRDDGLAKIDADELRELERHQMRLSHVP